LNDEKSSTETVNPEPGKFDDEEQLRRLTRSLKLAEKYFLFFASCNQIPRQDALIKRIKKELSGYKIEVVKFDKPIDSLLDELRRKLKNKKPDAVFVQGLRYSIPGAKKAKQTPFIANLNVTRDSFPKLLSCPMVLWLPEYAVGKIINGAPDFFSVRSGVFFFENDEKLMLQQISQAISDSYMEHDALPLKERQQRIENLTELLAEYQSLPEEKRDLQTEHQLKDKLADLYYTTANFAKAEKLRKELLNETRQKENNQEIPFQSNELALVYKSQGRYEEAIELFKQALEIDEKTIGKEHPHYATRLNNLANVYQLQGKYEEAIELFKQALEIDKKTIGKEHPHYATRLNNLANVYKLQDKYEEAIKLLKQALEIDKKTIGKEHPDYATRLNNLALVYKSQGRYEEAIELYKQALEIDEKTIGKEHPDYASGLNNLAVVYQLQGKYEEAIELFKQASEIDEKTIGKEHPSYAIRLSNLASVYQSQGRYEEALSLYEESLGIYENTLPENHPYIQEIREDLELCRRTAGKG
jgi:tetratricopeptide (TPR) repeat protein